MVKPSRRRALAQAAVAHSDISIKAACKAFSISETCYRYKAKLVSENQEIEAKLVELTQAQSDWGFGLCFDYLRNVEGGKAWKY